MVSLRKLPLWIAFVVVANAVPASAGHMEALAQISRTQFSTPIYAYEFDEADDVAVSASAEYLTDPLISGTAAATVDFNHLGARSSASRTGGTAQLIAFSRTRLEDTIQAYDADGNVLTTGSAMGFFHVDGQLSGYSRMDFSWEFGDPDGGQDGSGISVGSESTNSPLTLVDDYQPFLIQITGNELSLIMNLRAHSWTKSTAPTGTADFFTSGSLASIIYVNDLGLQDASVQFRSTTSGFRYPAPETQAVPEPASLALIGMGLLGSCAFARRKRRTAA